MQSRIWTRSAACAALLALATTGNSFAQSVEDFYRGKTITVYAAVNPGNTSAMMAQAFAEHIGQYIPGNPSATVEYMPGGGGLTAQNRIYATSPRDGTVLLLPNAGIAVSQLVTPSNVEYDAREYKWLGVVSPARHVLMVRQDTGVTSLEDLKTKELFIASTGAGSEGDMYPRVVNALLDTKMNVVPGFTGGQGEVMLALESGEMQGAVSGWQNWSARPDLVAIMTPILTFGAGRQPQVPDTPNLLEVVTNPEDEQIVRLIGSSGPIGRGFITTPDVPEERLEALRAAFDQVVQDPEFIAKIEAINLQVEPVSGAETQALVDDVLSMSPEIVERARQLMSAQ